MLFLRYFLLFCLMITPSAWAMELTAHVDQQTITSGDTFELYINAKDYHGSEAPDFGELNTHFNLVGMQQSQEIEVINGHTTEKTQWALMLLPRGTGQITIPSIRFKDAHTDPITLTVVSQQTNQQSNLPPPMVTTTLVDKPAIFLESNLTPQDAFVQQQIIYTVKIFFTGQLEGASLTDPMADQAKIMRMGTDRFYQTRKNGKIYNVIQRRYAVFPQKSGPLTIQPGTLQGNLVSANQNGTQWSRLFDAGILPVNTHAKPVTMDINPAPVQTGWWLPATHLKIEQFWSSDPNHLQIGQPITRTIIVTAQGLTAAQLPPLPQENLANVNIYPDKPIFNDQLNEQGVVGRQETKIAYVPMAGGSIDWPEISIPWWNTQTGKMEVATVQSMTAQVPSNGQAPSIQSPHPSNTQTIVKQPILKAPRHDLPWLIAGLFFILWIGTWFLLKKKPQGGAEKTRPQTLRGYEQQIKQACLMNNPHALKESLWTWGHVYFREQKLKDWASLINVIPDPALQEACLNLERILYKDSGNWNGQSFWLIFKTSHKKPVKKHSKTVRELPPLYSIHKAGEKK